MEFDVPANMVQSWMEVKAKTNSRSSSPQTIENAFAQVLKGTSGFAAEQLNQRQKANQPFTTYFIPVVVTTASLHLAHYDVRNINLYTGTIEKDKVSFGSGMSAEKLPWVLVNYGATESVASSLVPLNFYDNDPKQLLKHKLRSIFVVNSEHLVDFFNKLGST